MRSNRRGKHDSISTIASVVIVIIILVALALLVGATFLMSGKVGGVETSSVPLTSTPTNSSSSTTSESTSTSSSSIISSSTPISTASSSTTRIFSTSTSFHGTVNYTPSCFPLYTQGGVHVYGTISPTISGNIKSVELYWSYHGQNKWTWLNDLTYGPNFSSDGNFSHSWNPPDAGYYDFEANWTLSGGQVITGITSQPFQVVAQGSSCP